MSDEATFHGHNSDLEEKMRMPGGKAEGRWRWSGTPQPVLHKSWVQSLVRTGLRRYLLSSATMLVVSSLQGKRKLPIYQNPCFLLNHRMRNVEIPKTTVGRKIVFLQALIKNLGVGGGQAMPPSDFPQKVKCALSGKIKSKHSKMLQDTFLAQYNSVQCCCTGRASHCSVTSPLSTRQSYGAQLLSKGSVLQKQIEIIMFIRTPKLRNKYISDKENIIRPNWEDMKMYRAKSPWWEIAGERWFWN